MQDYQNLGGDSGVSAYEIHEDSISVEFKTGKVYEYSNGSAGSAHIENMKKLAIAGRGLNSYINTNPEVRNGYVK